MQQQLMLLLSLFQILKNLYNYRIGHTYWLNGFEEEAESYFNRGLELYNEELELDRGWTSGSYYYLAAFYTFRGERDKAYENLRLFKQILRDVKDNYQVQHEEVRKWLEENDML